MPERSKEERIGLIATAGACMKSLSAPIFAFLACLAVSSLALPADDGCLLEVCPQPGLHWIELDEIRVTSLRDAKGESIPINYELAAAQRAAVKSGRLDWKHLLEPGHARVWPREAIAFPLPAAPWRLMEGTVRGRVLLTSKECVFEDVAHTEKDRHEIADGVQMKLLEKRISDESVLCLRLRLDRYDDWLSEYPGQPLRRIRPGVVVFLGSGDIAAELLEVIDKTTGRTLPRLTTMASTPDDGKGLELELRYQAPVGGDEVYHLFMLHQRTVSVAFPFSLGER